jgi:protein-S-isoprenylcysteine O-methyltransferase Ste14
VTEAARTPETGEHAVSPATPIIVTCIFAAVLPFLLFWPAGTIDWRRGWLFLSIAVIGTFFAASRIARENPGLFAARSGFKSGTKPWDLILAPIITLLFLIVLPLAALDDARFHWAPQPDWVQLVGYALFCGGFAGVTWAQSVNPFFEAGVRIQTDRGHRVIDTGPYAWIRHPGYAFAIPFAAGMALSLGSIIALIPVAVAIILLAIRTIGEEAELRANLPGYADYTTRVKHRWFPGVW